VSRLRWAEKYARSRLSLSHLLAQHTHAKTLLNKGLSQLSQLSQQNCQELREQDEFRQGKD
jgi:hypothetical protein